MLDVKALLEIIKILYLCFVQDVQYHDQTNKFKLLVY